MLHRLPLLSTNKGGVANVRAKGDEATHSPRSWDTKGSSKLLGPLKRISIILSSRMVSRVIDITSATQEKRGCGVVLAVDLKKRTRGWTPNPLGTHHLYKPIVQHSTT